MRFRNFFTNRLGFGIATLLQDDSAFQAAELKHSIKDAVQMMNALKHPLV